MRETAKLRKKDSETERQTETKLVSESKKPRDRHGGVDEQTEERERE